MAVALAAMPPLPAEALAEKATVTTTKVPEAALAASPSGEGALSSGRGVMSKALAAVKVTEMLTIQGGMLKQLGYGALNFDVSSTSKLSIEGANLGLDFDLALSGRDIGTMTFAGSAAGIPAEAYAELQRAGSSGQQPDFNAVMPQIQNIIINVSNSICIFSRGIATHCQYFQLS